MQNFVYIKIILYFIYTSFLPFFFLSRDHVDSFKNSITQVVNYNGDKFNYSHLAIDIYNKV